MHAETEEQAALKHLRVTVNVKLRTGLTVPVVSFAKHETFTAPTLEL
jgi:hypothetical protein